MKKIFLFMMFSLLVLVSCESGIEVVDPNNIKTENDISDEWIFGDEEEPQAYDILDYFKIDYDFNFASEIFDDKTPIRYGNGSQRIIIYSDENISTQLMGGLPRFSMITSGELNTFYRSFNDSYYIYFDSFERVDLFRITGGYILPDFYIEYHVDMPLNEFPLILDFGEQFFALQHNFETNSIDLVEARVEERYIWGQNVVAYSPSGKIARIVGDGNYGRQTWVQISPESEYVRIELPNEGVQLDATPQGLLWLDDDILLITLQLAYKITGAYAGIYYYNVSDDSHGLIVGSGIEAYNMSFEWDKFVFYTSHWYYDTHGYFHVRQEMPKSQLYEIITGGDSLTFEHFNVPEIS